MARRVYSDAEKAEALDLYREHGACEAARRSEIPEKTITSWARRTGMQSDAPTKTAEATARAAQVRARKREELRTKLIEKANDLLDRMDHEHIDFKGKDATEVTYPKPSASGCQAYATAAAILLDKFRLELGEATARQEVLHTADVDGEIERLGREMAEA